MEDAAADAGSAALDTAMWCGVAPIALGMGTQADRAAASVGRELVCEPISGGVYGLREPAAGLIRYVGSTNSFARRGSEHLRSSTMNKLEMIILYPTGDSVEARLREQQFILEFGGVKGGQLLNKINAVSPRNPFARALQEVY